MSYADNYVRTRVVFVLVMLVLVLSAMLLLRPSGTPEEQRVSGVVVEVNRGEGEGLRSGQSASLVTARIAFENGQETRLPFFDREPQVGEQIAIMRLTFPNGEIRYRRILHDGALP